MKKTIAIVLLAGVAGWLALRHHSAGSTNSTAPMQLRPAMHAIVPEIQTCYEQDSSLPAELHVTANLDISRDADLGTRVEASVHTDDGSPLPREFASCMRSALETLDLPAPEHASHVTYPFMFRRAGS
jgi:hypothetical protein